ncbi:aspartyl protease family protein [Halopseudomonas xinjiangensis]|uniref:Aspartyl protease family protein n=1 Tax=Halopseudomonas xinjiangensis TaxID=487184 RepID=A0A1H1M2T1_9GAMM|nr:TIGR02281 family clan AA aspartic protease [Halopseudomonas xinjiangensis]SDR81056.1 aspartyl protease family protein [Halopseudomonas xinjiangensis]
MNEPPVRETRRVGTVMLILAWVVGLGLAALWFSGVEQAQRNPNQNPDSRVTDEMVEVRLEDNRNGHYVLSGEINDVMVTLLLDTGATMVAVPAELAGDLALKRGPAFMVSTANGMAESYRTRIDTLRIGDIQLRDVDAAIVPGMGGNEVLLGMTALRQLDFTQRGGELVLRQTLTETNR